MTNELDVNQEIVLIPLATRASNQPDISPDQNNPYWKEASFFFTITQAGTGGLTFNIDFKDPATGQYYTVFTSGVMTGTGQYVYGAGPAYKWSNYNSNFYTTGVAPSLSRTWRVRVTKADSSAWTYAVGASLSR